MSFDLIPSIKHFERGKSISAEFHANFDSEYTYSLSDGRTILNPAIISEVVGQLLSLLVFETTEYKKQALFFGVDQVEYKNVVRSGDLLRIFVFIDRLEEDFLVSRSEVYANDKLALETTTGKSILLPLDDYRNSDDSIRMFERKLHNEHDREVSNHNENLYQITAVKVKEGTLKLSVEFNSLHSLYEDHFPKKSIVPGVSLMTVIGEQAQRFDQRFDDDVNKIYLLPVAVENLKFKKELNPTDKVTIEMSIIESTSDWISTKQLITVDGRKVSHSTMKFIRL